jgi:hypothetical protein
MGMKMWSGCFSLDNEEVKDVTADKARRIWEILLKIRDEEQGEHNDYDVEVKPVEGRLVCAGGKKGNSPLAI